MRILVLGGNGFVGSHFVDHAVASGHEVSVLSRRPLPAFPHKQNYKLLQGDFETLLKNPQWLDGIDTVVHSAWSSVPKTAAADPIADVQSNIVGTLGVLGLLRKTPSVKHLMFLSSGGAVYGNVSTDAPIQETIKLDPLSAYGIGKLAAEKYCQSFAAETDCKVTILRPANPFGPGQKTIGLLGVVSTFLHHARNGTTALMFGDGSIVRDFVHVIDLALLMERIVTNPVPGIYNVGSGSGAALNDVLEAVQIVTGKALNIDRQPDRPFDPRRIVLDVKKAKDTFDWSPQYSLLKGIANLNSYLDQSTD